jgi:hypothetical protein
MACKCIHHLHTQPANIANTSYALYTLLSQDDMLSVLRIFCVLCSHWLTKTSWRYIYNSDWLKFATSNHGLLFWFLTLYVQCIITNYKNKPTSCTFCMYLFYNLCTTLHVSNDYFVHHNLLYLQLCTNHSKARSSGGTVLHRDTS